MNRFAAAVALLAVTVLTVPAAAASGSPPPASLGRLFGSENRRMPTDRREVALTFNAAWDETGVPEVLATLRQRDAPADFFLTGRFAERHPAAARAMAAEHGIGNHSYSHPLFDRLTADQAQQEVLRADRAIRAATGVVPLPFFRFPYSATTPQGIAAVNALGFADIEFSADTDGYLGTPGGMTVRKAVDRVMAALAPGEIVEMHVGVDESGEAGPTDLDAEALPLIIDAVRARGYQLVDLRTLLEG
ncbi:polysaccharide deacetylase family protein [Kitasatospora sp. NPDC052896]|uniref:polysaccharide deacetylase family protein n=1 Tax=Kitasatospora sp. NPDC052896 TaxID=3364061 RepID=UPI0037CBB9AB